MPKENLESLPLKQDNSLSWIIFKIILILMLLGFMVFLSYFLYQNIPGEPKRLNLVIDFPKLEISNLSYEVKQFYPNMKFNHNSISYNFDSLCDKEKRERMIKAFDELSSKVGFISFYENENADIEITCSEYVKEALEEDFFIAGEGGAKEIIRTERYSVVTNGVVLLHDNPHNFNKCPWPNIELHELLHVFGFDHSKDEGSLMYPYLESCDQKLDNSIIEDLKTLYSQKNLVDLYFENISAVKKGRYLDFNVTIKNSGVIDAEGVILSVFDGNEIINDFDLKDISFGAGLNYQVSNLKLKSRSSNNVKLVLDNGNLIEEIDESNNLVRLNFS